VQSKYAFIFITFAKHFVPHSRNLDCKWLHEISEGFASGKVCVKRLIKSSVSWQLSMEASTYTQDD